MTTQTIEKPFRSNPPRAGHAGRVGEAGMRWQYRPRVDIAELPDELAVYVDMPGVDAGNVDVNFENGALTIHGTAGPRQNASTSYNAMEYGVGDFHRAFAVSRAVDGTKITAELSDGVLTLHLPKTDAVKSRKIAVTSA